MKAMLIFVVMALLAVAVVVVVATSTVVAENPITDEPIRGNLECSSCKGSCSAESNCGRATCGALKGRSCGCGG